MKKANVELMRFLNAVLIIFCHMYMLDSNLVDWPLRGGYIAVEFFFILTGYFTALHWENILDCGDVDEGAEAKFATQYMIKKIVKVLPYTTLAYGIVYGYYFLINTDQYIRRSMFMQAIWDFSLLQTTGLSFFNYIQPLWYISSLIIILPIFSYLSIKYNDLFKNIICWMAPCVIYGYFAKEGTGVANSAALLRAFAGLCIGGLCFYLTRSIKVRIKSKSSILIKVGIALTVIVQLCIANTVRHSNDDFVIVIIYAIQIILLMLDKCNSERTFGRICGALGELSLPIYVFHPVVMTFVRDGLKNGEMGVQQSIQFKFIIALLLTIVISAIVVVCRRIIGSVIVSKKQRTP